MGVNSSISLDELDIRLSPEEQDLLEELQAEMKHSHYRPVTGCKRKCYNISNVKDLTLAQARVIAADIVSSGSARELIMSHITTRSDAAMQVLLFALLDSSEFTQVHIESIDFSDQSLRLLLSGLLHSSSKCQRLVIRSCGINDVVASLLGNAIRRFKHLKYLSLVDNELTHVGLEPLLVACARVPMERIDLTANQLSYLAADSLNSLFIHSRHCQHIILSLNPIGDNATFSSLHRLITLDLSYCGVGDEIVLQLCRFLRATLCQVEVLSLSPKITTEGAECLAGMLLDNCSLKELRLQGNREIRDWGAYALVRASASSPLVLLDLSMCGIGDHGLIDMGKVASDSRLVFLCLSNNLFDPEEARNAFSEFKGNVKV